MMECRFCKRTGLHLGPEASFEEFKPLENLSEEDRKPFLVCDKCYYGQRLDAKKWLKWLREECGQDAVFIGGCYIGLKGIGCGSPYIPLDEYYEGYKEDRWDKFLIFEKKIK